MKIHLPHMARVKRCEAFVPREDIPTVIMDVPEAPGRVEEVEAEERPLLKMIAKK